MVNSHCTPLRSGLTVSMPAAFANSRRLIEDVLGHPFTSSVTPARSQASLALWEEEAAYHLEVELPGFAQEAISLSVDDGTLHVKATAAEPQEQRKYLHNERRFGEIHRSIKLPETVDTEAIEAELDAGLLHLTLPKQPETQPHQIEVKLKS